MEEELNPNQSSEEEEDSQDHQRNENSRSSKGANQELEEETEEKVVQFLDSMDSYLILMDSLSSSLRQGWLELASARYAMGGSRVTSALFDLKLHPAATTLQVTELAGESPPQDPMVKEPHFSLSRWSSSGEEKCCSRETEFEEDELQKKNSTFVLRHRGTSQHYVDDECTSKGSPQSPRTVDQVQRERSKSLLIFGTLVSPKLRAAQSSFETALETLVEIANMRSLMLSAHSQIKQDMDGTVE
ncbi:coiled-coil protein [Thalictrum thalictroides]|uniref:Vacuolar ATPase assembly protein VMA22 n=1 Tax=Thalictrum thalictroides TaxID=46969 RepID=A0A7J6V635_THATH|nr:coiled-coil protein [Thalictrum thalictroides]